MTNDYIALEEIQERMKKVGAISASFGDDKKIFTHREIQAKLFLENNPLFFDRSGLFWLWDKNLKYYKLIDEVDLLNAFSDKNADDIVNSRVRTEILNALKQMGRRQIPSYKDQKLIQFKNGLAHVDYPELFEPNPSYMITNPIPHNYGSSEETPIIDAIFKQWVGEKYVETLHEILAYCILPDLPIHRLFCFVGSGRNGKSSFISLIRKFVGEQNVTTTDLDTLMNSRFEVTRLYKKLVCEMGETNLQEISKTQLIKKLTGGDLIGFEFKNKMPFEDKSYAKLIISTNTLPPSSDKSDGFYVRWVIIEFKNRFDEKIDILNTIPLIEYENLARRAMRTLQRLLKERRFTNEGNLDEKAEKYEELSNPFEKFLTQNLDLANPENYIGKGEFRNKLNSWLLEHKYRAMSDISISKKMKQHGFEESRITMPDGQQPRVWMGVGWK